MSKYTTELRFICENYAGLEDSAGLDQIDKVIDAALPKLFNFDFPIFDENYRTTLERKIVLHYYTREIGEEVVGLWKLRLRTKLNEIMPYYNRLYNTELLDFNPLYTADYYREGNRTGTDDNKTLYNAQQNSQDGGADSRITESERGGQDVTTGTREDSGSDTMTRTSRDKYEEWNLYSDTPQGGIDGIQEAGPSPSVADNGYLTDARHILHDGDGTTSTDTGSRSGTSDTSTTTDYGATVTTEDNTTYGRTNKTDNSSENNYSGKTTDDYVEHVYGRMPGASAAKLVQEFRETFLNIDMMIINDLEPLFMQLW